MCCQGEATASDRSLVQRSSTECVCVYVGVCVCVCVSLRVIRRNDNLYTYNDLVEEVRLKKINIRNMTL
jgi:hypothetical protein